MKFKNLSVSVFLKIKNFKQGHLIVCVEVNVVCASTHARSMPQHSPTYFIFFDTVGIFCVPSKKETLHLLYTSQCTLLLH